MVEDGSGSLSHVLSTCSNHVCIVIEACQLSVSPFVPEPSKVVRIVDDTSCNLATVPREGSVTLDAKHLITSINLVDESGAFRTGFCILCQKLDGLNRVLVAFMRLSSHFSARSTDMLSARSAHSILDEARTVEHWAQETLGVLVDHFIIFSCNLRQLIAFLLPFVKQLFRFDIFRMLADMSPHVQDPALQEMELFKCFESFLSGLDEDAFLDNLVVGESRHVLVEEDLGCVDQDEFNGHVLFAKHARLSCSFSQEVVHEALGADSVFAQKTCHLIPDLGKVLATNVALFLFTLGFLRSLLRLGLGFLRSLLRLGLGFLRSLGLSLRLGVSIIERVHDCSLFHSSSFGWEEIQLFLSLETFHTKPLKV